MISQANDIKHKQFIIKNQSDLKKAEQYQNRMYTKYNSVTVHQNSPTIITIQCSDKIK